MIHGRKLFQFSLRGFLIATALFAAWLGWFARQAQLQRQAVAIITAAGGTVGYDSHFEVRDNGMSCEMRVDHRGPLLERLINSLGLEQANPAVPAGQETLMERFSTALGQDYFARVTSAVLVATSDFDHSCLDALPDLEYLEVPSADPEVLRRAKRLGNLRVLQVTASALTPSEISSLKKQLPGCYILVTVYAPE